MNDVHEVQQATSGQRHRNDTAHIASKLQTSDAEQQGASIRMAVGLLHCSGISVVRRLPLSPFNRIGGIPSTAQGNDHDGWRRRAACVVGSCIPRATKCWRQRSACGCCHASTRSAAAAAPDGAYSERERLKVMPIISSVAFTMSKFNVMQTPG